MTTGPDTTPAPQSPEPAPGPEPGAVPTQRWAPPAAAVPPQGWAPPAGPAVPPQGWAPGPPLPAPPVRRSRARALRVAVPVVAAVAIGALRLTGVWGGAQDPQVGDCVHTTDAAGTSFDVVDCSAKDAQYKVVGIDPKRMTSKDFQADDSLCSSVPETTYVMWSGTDPDEGTVYCGAPVGAAG